MRSDIEPIAQVRHPHMVRRSSELEQSDAYRALAGQLDSLLESLREVPPDVRFRFAHDWLVDVSPTITDIRGSAVHGMVWDHSYEEVAAMVGLSRQRLQSLHQRWLELSMTEPHAKHGRWSRIFSRRQKELTKHVS